VRGFPTANSLSKLPSYGQTTPHFQRTISKDFFARRLAAALGAEAFQPVKRYGSKAQKTRLTHALLGSIRIRLAEVDSRVKIAQPIVQEIINLSPCSRFAPWRTDESPATPRPKDTDPLSRRRAASPLNPNRRAQLM